MIDRDLSIEEAEEKLAMYIAHHSKYNSNFCDSVRAALLEMQERYGWYFVREDDLDGG